MRSQLAPGSTCTTVLKEHFDGLAGIDVPCTAVWVQVSQISVQSAPAKPDFGIQLQESCDIVSKVSQAFLKTLGNFSASPTLYRKLS